jgi:hypothetical protein
MKVNSWPLSSKHSDPSTGIDLLHMANAVGFPAGDIQAARVLDAQLRFRVERQ